jgi:hypothetical protein
MIMHLVASWQFKSRQGRNADENCSKETFVVNQKDGHVLDLFLCISNSLTFLFYIEQLASWYTT